MDVRILIVGRQTQPIENAFRDAGVEVDTAALPAAAVRQMEAEPPDVLCLVEPTPNPKTKLLIEGIRARPLGQLTPIVAVAPAVEFLTELVELQVEPGTPPDQLVRLVHELLGVAFTPQAQEADEDVPYYIEEIVETAARPVASANFDTTLDVDVIRRKLRAVRHEDYFVILEIGRGSETMAVREAFYRLTRLFDLRHAPFDVAQRFEPEILEISDALEDAWAVLGDVDLRRNYLEQTSRR